MNQPALNDVLQELAVIPENQPLYMYLPDVCYSRHELPNPATAAIMPLLRDLLAHGGNVGGSRLDQSPLAVVTFREDELAASFSMQAGPPPLTIKELSAEDQDAVKRQYNKQKHHRKSRHQDHGQMKMEDEPEHKRARHQ